MVATGFDQHGEPLVIEGTELLARALQHETDHLDGILFFDRMTSMQSLTYLDEYSRYHVKSEDDEGKDQGDAHPRPG